MADLIALSCGIADLLYHSLVTVLQVVDWAFEFDTDIKRNSKTIYVG